MQNRIPTQNLIPERSFTRRKKRQNVVISRQTRRRPASPGRGGAMFLVVLDRVALVSIYLPVDGL